MCLEHCVVLEHEVPGDGCGDGRETREPARMGHVGAQEGVKTVGKAGEQQSVTTAPHNYVIGSKEELYEYREDPADPKVGRRHHVLPTSERPNVTATITLPKIHSLKPPVNIRQSLSSRILQNCCPVLLKEQVMISYTEGGQTSMTVKCDGDSVTINDRQRGEKIRSTDEL